MQVIARPVRCALSKVYGFADRQVIAGPFHLGRWSLRGNRPIPGILAGKPLTMLNRMFLIGGLWRAYENGFYSPGAMHRVPAMRVRLRR